MNDSVTGIPYGSTVLAHGRAFTETLENSPLLRAWNDLERYQAMLRGLASIVPGTARPTVLDWLRDWRLYLLEKNLKRWPDGRFYVLDRDYLPWRGHALAFSPDELRPAFLDCCIEWPRSWKAKETFYEVMSDECYFKARRAPYVLGVASIVRGICHAALARLDAQGQTPKVRT